MSAVETKKAVLPIVGKFVDSEGQDPAIFDRAVKALLGRSEDKLGTIWACIKVIEEREAALKAQADRANLLRKHLGATREWLRDQGTALLVELEATGQDASVKRTEFAAHLHASQSVEGPVKDEEWPELLQKRQIVVKADRAGALARIKAGEVFEGLKLVTSRVIKFA